MQKPVDLDWIGTYVGFLNFAYSRIQSVHVQFLLQELGQNSSNSIISSHLNNRIFPLVESLTK
jgi:hypothetical protein